MLFVQNLFGLQMLFPLMFLQFSLNLRYQDNLVITYLQPGVEYCVNVSVRTFFGANSVASEPRCAYTSRPQQPASRTLAPLSSHAQQTVLFLVIINVLIHNVKLGDIKQ